MQASSPDPPVAARAVSTKPPESSLVGAHPAVEAVSVFRLPEPRSVVIWLFPRAKDWPKLKGLSLGSSRPGLPTDLPALHRCWPSCCSLWPVFGQQRGQRDAASTSVNHAAQRDAVGQVKNEGIEGDHGSNRQSEEAPPDEGKDHQAHDEPEEHPMTMPCQILTGRVRPARTAPPKP